MPFNGSEGAPIELTTAASWTANYRNANSEGIKAHFFGKDILNEILAQEGCEGIRIYYALDDSGTQQLILVGADASENDMVDGVIADYSKPCPYMCGVSNSLNS